MPCGRASNGGGVVSATGRKKGVRVEQDVYPTPAWCVRRLLEKVPLPGGYWLEPCAGEGHIISAVSRVRTDVAWHAVEYRTECASGLSTLVGPEQAVSGDFLTFAPYWASTSPTPRYQVILTNPPYGQAMEFIEACLPLAENVVMLLRLNFLASTTRHRFMSTHTPDVAVLPNRPSFVGGKTDATEYCWMIWGRQATGRLIYLDCTPSGERRAGLPVVRKW